MPRLQFNLKTMVVASFFFALGLTVQQWFDRARIDAVEIHEKFVRNYEAGLADHAARDVAAAKRAFAADRVAFDEEMGRLRAMLEQADEGERRARQELVKSLHGR
ncbi:MAG TPA: hypothetical protein VHC22_02180 [Pirellulales bacterium]|nr:hypothetical protein [Pirellulales bacterium]